MSTKTTIYEFCRRAFPRPEVQREYAEGEKNLFYGNPSQFYLRFILFIGSSLD